MRPYAGRADAHFYLGLVADARGATDEAVSQYRLALQNDANNSGVYDTPLGRSRQAAAELWPRSGVPRQVRAIRCVVILSNDVRAEAGFADLVRFILGDTGVPYDWEYGDHAGKS